MRDLILVRHSDVVQQPTGSSHEWVLSENGRSRATTLATQLSPHQPTRIFTSEEPKARDTGKLLAEKLEIEWETAVGLQEHSRKNAPYFEDVADFQEAIRQLFLYPDELMFGQETAVQARTRFTHTVQKLMDQHPHDKLAIVTHGTVMTLFIAHHTPNLDPIPFWQNLKLPDFHILTVPDKLLL